MSDRRRVREVDEALGYLEARAQRTLLPAEADDYAGHLRAESGATTATEQAGPGLPGIEDAWGRELEDERATAPPKPSVAFLSDRELAAMPPVEWLIRDVLPMGGLSYLIGLRGVGKTLLALEWAISVALGRSWEGLATKRGGVRYVAAEGARSLHARVNAWKAYNGLGEVDSCVRWHPHRLPLLDRRSVDEFLQAAVLDGPTDLLVVDTLPRCTQGAKENDSDGIGRALEHVDLIREALNAAVLLVTHPARAGEDLPRGHSSQEGAADAIWVLKDNDGERLLSSSKMKDSPEGDFTPFSRHLVACHGSVVLAPSSGAESPSSRLTEAKRAVLKAVRDMDPGIGLAASVIIESGKLHKGTVYKVLRKLTDGGHLRLTRAGRYSITVTGLGALGS